MNYRLNHSVDNISYSLFNKNLVHFSLFVLLFSVLRGLVPILSKNGSLALPTYHFSYLLGIILATYGFYYSIFFKNQRLYNQIRYLLILNFLITIYWLLPLLILVPSEELLIDLAYKCWFPFAVFAFVKVPENKMITAFKIITIIVSGFVLLDFISLNTMLIPNGFDTTLARYKLLRPDFQSLSQNAGLYLRPNGILGAGLLPHDSANLLAIFSVFWLSLLFREQKKYSVILLAILSIVTLLLSQSASNIVVGLFGILIILFCFRRKLFSFLNIFKLSVVFIPLISWFNNKYPESIAFLGVWTNRIGVKTGAWADMTYYGDAGFQSNLYSFFFGYGQSLKLSKVAHHAEQAFIKAIFEYGIFHAIVFFLLLSAPVLIYVFKGNKKHRKYFFPYFIAVLVGFLSLVHYGSVLRTTNIFVFFAMYGQFLKIFTPKRLE